jgi:hypothetical protein
MTGPGSSKGNLVSRFSDGQFSRSLSNKFELVNGAEIKFLAEAPIYEVTTCDGSPDPKLVLTRKNGRFPCEHDVLPPTIEISADNSDKFVIGRGLEANCRPDGDNQQFSREHVYIRFVRGAGWILEPFNRNPGSLRWAHRVESQGVSDPMATQFVSDESLSMRSHNRIISGELVLVPGMMIDWVPRGDFREYTPIPAYAVRAPADKSDEDTGLISLEIPDDARGFPQTIELCPSKSPLTLGRADTNDVILRHTRISNNHAAFVYDSTIRSWSLQIFGENLPGISVKGELLELANKEILSSTTQQTASKCRSQIIKLIDSLERYRGEMDNVAVMGEVQILEEDSIRGAMRGEQVPKLTERAQRGYFLWLKAYGLLVADSLAPDESKSIQDATRAIKSIGKTREGIRRVGKQRGERYTGFCGNFNKDVAHLKSSDMHENGILVKLVDQITNDFKAGRSSEIYLATGMSSHHTVTIIKNNSGRVSLISYNAGLGAQPTEYSNNVFAKMECSIKEGVNVSDLVLLLAERKLHRYKSSEGQALDRSINSVLADHKYSQEVSPQHKRNCTTRSTREFLRDFLPGRVFNHFHKQVASPELSDPKVVLAALQIRLKMLEKYILRKGWGLPSADSSKIDWSRYVD